MDVPKIYYTDSLVQAFERSLRDAFNPRYVRLSRRSSKAVGRFNVVLEVGDREFKAADADEAQNVIAICHTRVPQELFWLAFKANFEFWESGGKQSGGKHYLEHISLSVLQKAPTGDLVRMFRADWDSRAASDSASTHAQPHWHFAMEEDDFLAVFDSGGPQDVDFTDLIEFDPTTPFASQLVDFKGFHFAMSPLWHEGEASCHRQVFESEDVLTSWFSNLSRYIAEQLLYVSEKVGASPSVSDFR